MKLIYKFINFIEGYIYEIGILVYVFLFFFFVDINDFEILNVIKVSYEMKNKFYCFYSKFRVGVVLFCEDGIIIIGIFILNL